jgi:hypothetical protein
MTGLALLVLHVELLRIAKAAGAALSSMCRTARTGREHVLLEALGDTDLSFFHGVSLVKECPSTRALIPIGPRRFG